MTRRRWAARRPDGRSAIWTLPALPGLRLERTGRGWEAAVLSYHRPPAALAVARALHGQALPTLRQLVSVIADLAALAEQEKPPPPAPATAH